MEKLHQSIDKFVEAKCSDIYKRWNKKIDERIEDSNLTEDARMHQITLDWFNDHKKLFNNIAENKISKDEEQTLKEGCLLIKRLLDHNLTLPSQIENDLTTQDIIEFCKFIEGRLKNN